MFGQNNKDKIIAVGMNAKELVDLLSTNKAADAMRALAYLDGQQEPELIKVLNDPNKGRARWQQRGIIPRFRNVTKMVVEKSGMLFKDTLPVMQVFDKLQNSENAQATQMLAEKLSEVEHGFHEYMVNFDSVLRLLKTAMVLVQWDEQNDTFMFDTLHRGNSEVIIDPMTRKPMCLVFKSHENGYWVWTSTEITEIRIEGDALNRVAEVVGISPNPYGIIPIATFYDTNTPRTGYWVEQDKSLVNLNEMVNLHITDSEFSNLWMKMSTPVTNMRPAGAGSVENIEYTIEAGDVLPRARVDATSLIGGPNQVITMDSMGVDSPFFEYKGPVVDLKQLNEVVDNWIKGYASDWSVSIRAQGEGRAESGFQLIVEEMGNLDLRKQRQRMYESGFKRLYTALRAVHNTATGTQSLPDNANLYAVFNDPVLPIDVQIEETVWSIRIKEERATPIDYFRHVWGMSKEEAELKYQEIQDFKAAHAPAPVAVPEVPADNTDTQDNADAQALADMTSPDNQTGNKR